MAGPNRPGSVEWGTRQRSSLQSIVSTHICWAQTIEEATHWSQWRGEGQQSLAQVVEGFCRRRHGQQCRRKPPRIIEDLCTRPSLQCYASTEKLQKAVGFGVKDHVRHMIKQIAEYEAKIASTRTQICKLAQVVSEGLAFTIILDDPEPEWRTNSSSSWKVSNICLFRGFPSFFSN